MFSSVLVCLFSVEGLLCLCVCLFHGVLSFPSLLHVLSVHFLQCYILEVLSVDCFHAFEYYELVLFFMFYLKDSPFRSLHVVLSVSSMLSVFHLSVLYLRSAGQSGCIEGWAASKSALSLRLELSLAMRGNAVMSTEKR